MFVLHPACPCFFSLHFSLEEGTKEQGKEATEGNEGVQKKKKNFKEKHPVRKIKFK